MQETQETEVQSLGQKDSLEEANSTPLQYSYLEIPRAEESGGLQSMGPQRIGHNLVSEQQQLHASMHAC